LIRKALQGAFNRKRGLKSATTFRKIHHKTTTVHSSWSCDARMGHRLANPAFHRTGLSPASSMSTARPANRIRCLAPSAFSPRLLSSRLRIALRRAQFMRITQPFKLASRQFTPEGTIVDLWPLRQIAARNWPLPRASWLGRIARTNLFPSRKCVAKAGAKILRCGAFFKPRTSPYAFQGMGEPGLKLMRKRAKIRPLHHQRSVAASQIQIDVG